MLTSIKVYNGKDRRAFKEWTNKIDQACRASRHHFRTEIIIKSRGGVRTVFITSKNCSNEELLAKLRGSFSDAPPMNQAREELRNMQQGESESIAVYAYQWGRALVSLARINPDRECHPTWLRTSFHCYRTSGTK